VKLPKNHTAVTDYIPLKKSKKLTHKHQNGGNMSKNVTIYTGTFTKLNGDKRTMSFIRQSDLPSSMVNSQTINEMQQKTGNEVVFDTDKKQFRQFNWKTVQGKVTERNTTFSF
tara:strand:- start:147 stop:485 length:339 start_codon:yes stop_codon:yes gene_type:complete